MFKRLIYHQRHGRAVFNPDHEASANPKLFNGTWSPWQVLENNHFPQKANEKIPYPHNKCYKEISHIKKGKESKKSLIPEKNVRTNAKSFLDDLFIKVFKNSNLERKQSLI